MTRIGFAICVALGLILAPISAAQARKLAPPGTVVVLAELEGTDVAGVLAPAGGTEIDIRPEQYSGLLEVVECVKTGPVEGGQVLLKLSTEWIDEQIERAGLDYEIAKTGFEMARVDHAAAVKDLELKRDHAQRSHRLAKEALERYEDEELALRTKEAKQNIQAAKDRLADQREELAQLEKMYAEDDLTEETEEIVLKRARRGLKNAQERLKHRLLRNDWYLDTTLPREHESRTLEVRKQEVSLRKFTETLSLRKRKSNLEHKKATIALEKRIVDLKELIEDRSLLTVRAPAGGGVAIPASFRGGRWGSLGQDKTGYQPRQRIKARQILFTVFDAQRLAVRTTLSQAQLHDVQVGMQAIVTSTAANGLLLPATVKRVSEYSSDGKYEVWLSLGERHDALRAGQSVQVGIHKSVSKAYPAVPASCVVKDGDEHYVRVLGGLAGPERRVVEIEARFAGLVGLSGVQVSEQVQLDPPAPKKKPKKAKKSGKQKSGKKKASKQKDDDAEDEDGEEEDVEDHDEEDDEGAKTEPKRKAKAAK